MKTYIGTKIVRMKPMTRAEYNKFRGWTLPADEDGSDAGYLVEYLDGGKPNVAGYTGYISWSPAEQAEAAYRETSGMSFGLAIEAMKKGKLVARSGWNGKGMWIVMIHPGNAMYTKVGTDGAFPMQPCIGMKTADDNMQPGWLASQADMLADDWMIVE